MAWVFIGCSFLCLPTAIYISLVIPTELAPLREDAPQPQESEICVTKLVPEDRGKVVHNMIMYGFERPFSIAAIEVPL